MRPIAYSARPKITRMVGFMVCTILIPKLAVSVLNILHLRPYTIAQVKTMIKFRTAAKSNATIHALAVVAMETDSMTPNNPRHQASYVNHYNAQLCIHSPATWVTGTSHRNYVPGCI